MSSDRELLEWYAWNPLTDDGDALRLAVKLNLVIDITPWAADCALWSKFSHGQTTDAYQSKEGDHYAATRRAIVRAAATLGRASSGGEEGV